MKRIENEYISNKNLLLDAIAITPFEDSNFYFQCNESDITPELQKELVVSENPALYKVKLSKEVASILTKEVEVNNLQLFFSHVLVKKNDSLQYEMFDGCEFGIFSKDFSIPEWFVEKYQPSQMYSVSKDW